MNSSDRKDVYILVGPKGSGKSYIGCILERRYGIRFLRVERLLIEHSRRHGLPDAPLRNDGFDLEEEAMREILEREDAVISEATGSSIYLLGFLKKLDSLYHLRLIRIYCPLDVCFARVQKRAANGHFEVADEALRRINEKSASIELNWDLEIDNSGPASNKHIFSQFDLIKAL